MTAIVCEGVHRHFGENPAVDGVDLVVQEHQIFGLIGPNGCGKTTLLNQIQGLDRPTSGTVSVLGLDPIRDHGQLMLRIGAQLQEATMIPRLTVREAISTFAGLYPRAQDVDLLIERVGLTGQARQRVERLSGGQRQRVFIALAQVHEPELLFFDELTSAVDPQARQAIWHSVRGLREQGRTILLTTHSMEEAEALCDRIAIMDAGRIIAVGTPADLVAQHTDGAVLTLALADAALVDRAALQTCPGVTSVTGQDGDLRVTGRGQFAPSVLSALAAQGVRVTGMHLDEPRLEDVFLALTGRSLRQEQ